MGQIANAIEAVIASIDALPIQDTSSNYARQNLVWSQEAMTTYEANPPTEDQALKEIEDFVPPPAAGREL